MYNYNLCPMKYKIMIFFLRTFLIILCIKIMKLRNKSEI